MAENETNDNGKPTLDIADIAPEKPKTQGIRLRGAFNIPDKEKLAGWIIESHNSAVEERGLRSQRRQARRARLMGWMSAKNWPWKNASQVFLPIMQIANLKVREALENSIKAIHPMMSAKAKQRRNTEKEESINQILDHQLFIENMGESLIDTFCVNFVEDEAVFGLVQYVKEDQNYYEVRRLPALDPAQDVIVQLLLNLKLIFPNLLSEKMTDEKGLDWEVSFQDDEKQIRTASVKYYQNENGEIEAVIVKQVCAFDGPALRILDFDDVYFPSRSANLQPPSSSNPEGAPWVDVRFRVNLDTIRRRMADKTYDQVDQDDWKKTEASDSVIDSGNTADLEKQQKDDHEGGVQAYITKREDRTGVMRFCRLDINGDDLEEDVIVWVLQETKLILKVALLSESYPGVPVRRPIITTCYIPIANRVMGISNSELVESLQTGAQTALDQHIDWGTITNMPMGFYRAASGLKAEPIYQEPGMMYPLDDPARDINFPQWPTKDSTFAINTITLLQQYVEMIEMQSQASYGRVPTGKASAFRTTGTTMALLSQTDARAEQVLRRVFAFFGGMFELMHRLNKRFLPEKKEIRLVGVLEPGKDEYKTIDRNDIDAEVDFEFKATFLNTNKQMLSQNLSEIIGLALTPFAFQAGLITLDKMYTILRDKTKALDLDPDKYWTRPPDPFPGPKLLAEEVISAILTNQLPEGGPMENPQEHLAKLEQYVQTDALGFMNSTQAKVLAQWMGKIKAFLMQQEQMMASMQSMAQQNGGQAEGPGGAPTTLQTPGIGDNQNLKPNQQLDKSIGGVQ